CMEVLEFPWTF
nr:immunoglobulin light chain junction region [Macaca mulatta]